LNSADKIIGPLLHYFQLLKYGFDAVAAPINYVVEISGANIATNVMTTTGSSSVTFDLPANDSDIFAAAGAQNVFGEQPLGVAVESEIGKFVVNSETSTVTTVL